MKKYNVYIEINGSMVLIGSLNSKEENSATFQYDANYLNLENAKAMSIALPLQSESFTEDKTRSFFEALLPEGFSRQSLANSIRKNENDYIGLLSVVGRECIGAILISDATCDLTSEYIPIDDAMIKSLAAEGASKSAEILTKTHLSLAGATGKVGLFLDDKTGKWYLPQGLAPSTHIIKQSHVRYKDIVVNEALCLNLAKKCGINVPESFIIETDGKADSDILFAVKRFDRYSAGGKIHRLHQEDFAQALSIASNHKYEIEGAHHMQQMFSVLKNYSANPIEDQIKLFRMIAFNVIIGNTDAHLKNYSLVYDKYLGNRRLSPAYDMLCTAYHGTTNMLSFNINGKYDINEVTRGDLLQAAKEAGLGSKIANKALEDLCNSFELNAKEASYELVDQGFAAAKNILDAILTNANTIMR
ncbi:MAG: HipA domain-containing protein [Bacillota bacterium]|nr:HipA domain-containing protein [Bacillota bacterium]